METTIKDITKNLETLPKELLNQVNEYVDFLKDCLNVKTEISQWQKDEVMRRKKDAEENPDTMKPIEDLFKLLDEDDL